MASGDAVSVIASKDWFAPTDDLRFVVRRRSADGKLSVVESLAVVVEPIAERRTGTVAQTARRVLRGSGEVIHVRSRKAVLGFLLMRTEHTPAGGVLRIRAIPDGDEELGGECTVVLANSGQDLSRWEMAREEAAMDESGERGERALEDEVLNATRRCFDEELSEKIELSDVTTRADVAYVGGSRARPIAVSVGTWRWAVGHVFETAYDRVCWGGSLHYLYQSAPGRIGLRVRSTATTPQVSEGKWGLTVERLQGALPRNWRVEHRTLGDFEYEIDLEFCHGQGSEPLRWPSERPAEMSV
jgi:hypothetical protein